MIPPQRAPGITDNPSLWTWKESEVRVKSALASELERLRAAVKRQQRPGNPSPLTPVIPKAVSSPRALKVITGALNVFIITFQAKQLNFSGGYFYLIKVPLKKS